jgi:hypothetical protein
MLIVIWLILLGLTNITVRDIGYRAIAREQQAQQQQ